MSLECSFFGSEDTGHGISLKNDRKTPERFHSSRVKTKRDAGLLIELFPHRGRCLLYPATYVFDGIV